MMALKVEGLIASGNDAVGASRWKATVSGDGPGMTPSGTRTPLNTDSACDCPLGSVRRLNVVITSAAVTVWPFWNFTFGRSLTVHTVASAFGLQAIAISG